jgi:hypothetical protein
MADINIQLSDPAGQTAAAFESGMRIASMQGVGTDVVLHAMARGATHKGDALLFKTLAVICGYLTSWGAWVILVLGMFQLVQSTTAIIEKFISVFQKVGSLFGAAGKVLDFLMGKLKADGEGELLVKSTVALVTSAVPEAGIAIGIFGKVMGTASDRVGGVVHDGEDNYGTVPVSRANFKMVDQDMADNELEDAVLDIAGSLGQAAVAAGADPERYMDMVERVLHDEIPPDNTYHLMHDHASETLDDLADEDED